MLMTERWWRGKTGAGKHERLEQRAHLPRIDEPRGTRGDGFRLRGRGALKQTLAARRQAELEQELSLRHRSMGGQSGGDRLALEIGEIDMGGEVGRAGIGKDIGEAMAAHGLQRVAEAGTPRDRNR